MTVGLEVWYLMPVIPSGPPWLYYNAVLWLTPELNSMMKQGLLSISANALRSCRMSFSSELSFVTIHSIFRICTPAQIMSYQLSLQLHKSLSEMYDLCTTVHAPILNNIVCKSRQLNFEILRNSRSKIGMNTALNKFYHISKMISLNNLNLSFVHYKRIMKIQFLKNGRT